MKQFTRTLILAVSLLGQTALPLAAVAQAVQEQEQVADTAQDANGNDGLERPAAQDPFYCGERKLGTWFYCDAPRPKSKKDAESPQTGTATERLAVITKTLDEMRAKAILEPTTQNVASYIRYQREQLDRASTFADVWQRALWQDPSLDYTLQRPVNTVGKSVWSEQRQNDQKNVMANLSKRYGLFYFYSSQCAACAEFSPIVKSLSDQFNLSVLPVSMDGGANPYFRNFAVDSGQYSKMGLKGGTVPALVLFDTVTKEPMPIGYGAMAADEVMDHIFRLTSVKAGSDF